MTTTPKDPAAGPPDWGQTGLTLPEFWVPRQ